MVSRDRISASGDSVVNVVDGDPKDMEDRGVDVEGEKEVCRKVDDVCRSTSARVEKDAMDGDEDDNGPETAEDAIKVEAEIMEEETKVEFVKGAGGALLKIVSLIEHICREIKQGAISDVATDNNTGLGNR